MLKLVRHGTPLAQVKFNLKPSGLRDDRVDLVLSDPEQRKLDATYRLCYYAVFGSLPKTDRLTEKLIVEIAGTARECRATLRLYLLASMYAHREASPEREFFPALLVKPGAIGRVEFYRASCAKKFGTFDLKAFETLTSTDATKFERALEFSERMFASYIRGSKQHGQAVFDQFYRDFELSLDKYWCAIEPTYVDQILMPHVKGTCSDATQRHRHAAVLAHTQLKRSRSNAAAVFDARSRAAAAVLRDLWRDQLAQLSVDHDTITNSAELWTLLTHHG